MYETLMKALLDRSHELDRRRTRQLATQQWAKVIETEAALKENELIRERVTIALNENSPVKKEPTP